MGISFIFTLLEVKLMGFKFNDLLRDVPPIWGGYRLLLVRWKDLIFFYIQQTPPCFYGGYENTTLKQR